MILPVFLILNIDDIDRFKQNELPPFINRIYNINTENGYYDDSLCIEINQEPFWVPVSYNDNTNHVIDTLEISIGRYIYTEYRILAQPLMQNYYVYDDFGKKIGWYPSPFTLCIDTNQSLNTNQVAKLRIVSILGDNFTYSWYLN